MASINKNKRGSKKGTAHQKKRMASAKKRGKTKGTIKSTQSAVAKRNALLKKT